MLRRMQVIGNLTKDAEVKNVNNKKVINFCVATNDVYKDSNGDKCETKYYYNCSVWRDSNVTVANYLTKGTRVFIEGTPEVEIYKTRNGEIKGDIKIVVSNFYLIGGGSNPSNTGINNQNNSENNKNDDLPF